MDLLLFCFTESKSAENYCSDRGLQEITYLDFAENRKGNCIVLGQARQFLALSGHLMVFQLLWMCPIHYFACIQ